MLSLNRGPCFSFLFCGFAASLYGGPGCFPFRSRQTRIFYECCAAFLLMCMLRSKLAVRGLRNNRCGLFTGFEYFYRGLTVPSHRVKSIQKNSFQASLRSFLYAFLLTNVSVDHSKINPRNKFSLKNTPSPAQTVARTHCQSYAHH